MNAAIETSPPDACSILELDFGEERRLAHERETREAANWTEEARCARWLFVHDSLWLESWKALPKYDREGWLLEYRIGRQAVESGGRMPSASLIMAHREAAWKQTKELAESWARDIRAAFLERKPCPIIPAPGFEHVLHYAFDLAQVPVGCLAAAAVEEDPVQIESGDVDSEGE